MHIAQEFVDDERERLKQKEGEKSRMRCGARWRTSYRFWLSGGGKEAVVEEEVEGQIKGSEQAAGQV